MTTVELEPVPEQQGDRDTDTGHAARETMRAFRRRRTVPAAIVAALLAAGTLLTAAEVISRLVDRPLGVLPVGWLSRLGRETTWQDPLALTVAAVAVAVGLLLIWFACWPGRARMIPLPSGDPDAATAITRAGLARHVTTAAQTVDGVDRARAAVGRSRVRVQVDSPLRDPQGLSEQVHRAVGQRLDELAPLRPLRVRVAVRRGKDQP